MLNTSADTDLFTNSLKSWRVTTYTFIWCQDDEKGLGAPPSREDAIIHGSNNEHKISTRVLECQRKRRWASAS